MARAINTLRVARGLRRVAATSARFFAAFALLVALGACAAGVAQRVEADPERYFAAQVPGVVFARFFGDKPPEQHDFDLDAWRTHRLPILQARTPPGREIEAHILLLSGGGPDGAFGAGLLTGWTAHGTRPEFEIVTGVSIGALMAPFAFLGPEYDARLREMFLRIRGEEDVFSRRLFSLLGGGLSLADSAPLRLLIEEYVDAPLLERIAAEHRLGRRLFVGTTYLDARRPVTWNMGAIAASDAPGRLQLFRDVLLASAAIPGLAPPVYIETDLNGVTVREMHVDGGVMNSVVFAAPEFLFSLEREGMGRFDATVWVIQNNKLRAPYRLVEDSFTGVLGDSLSELIRTQSRGDQARLFFLARENGLNYRLAAVPVAYDETGAREFAPEYLRGLYDFAENLARDGYPWRDTPPSLRRLGAVEGEG